MSCLGTETTPLVLPCAHPLDELYQKAGLALPLIEGIPGHQVPAPYQELLVHDGDMTPTLEAFHRSRLHLEVIRRERRGDFYFREVLLKTDDGNKPVEFGAIKINLSLFPTAAKEEILREYVPLGSILANHKIEHYSRPKAFLRVKSDDFINQVFSLSGHQTLFGRRNTLSNSEQHPLAEIVEILPPTSLTR